MPMVDLEVNQCRIIEYYGLEGTFRGHLAQPSSSEQGHLQLDHVVVDKAQVGCASVSH